MDHGIEAALPLRRAASLVLVGVLAVGLAGCESGRFAGLGRPTAARARAPEPIPEPVTPAVPSGSVIAEPLAPPPGGAGTPVASLPPGGGEVSPMPGGPQPVPTLGGGGGPEPSSGPSSRSAAVGGWTAREASGSCKVNLSSTPSLDLYRASASGCANKDLGRVTAWDYRDGEVYLFQPGGAVAARLRPGGGGLTGVLAKSGAPISMTRG